MGTKNVSITTIAAEAYVSIKTVSNYINGTSTFPMSEKTKTAVRAAMRRHNFRLNASGSLMRSGKGGARKAVFIFGYHPELHPTRVHTVPEVSPLLAGIAEELSGFALELTVRHVPNTQSDNDWLRAIIDAEAVIVYGTPYESLVSMCDRRNIPLVLLANSGAGVASDPVIDTIYWPREEAVRLSLDHLASQGVTRSCYISTWNIARMTGGRWNTQADLALEYYEETVGARSAGAVIIEPQPDDTSPEAEIKNGYQAVMKHKKTLLGREAVIAENDYIAMGAILALRDLGKRVGVDARVIGCGDFRESAHFTPSITTVAFDREKCVAALAALLKEKIADNDRRPRTIPIPLTLLLRESA